MKFPNWARLLLAAALVPVVVFSNPQTASAAGDWQQVTVSGSSETGKTKCWLAIRLDGLGGLQVGTGAYCQGGPDITLGSAQTGEAGSSYDIFVTGTLSTTTSCGGDVGGTLGAHSSNGTANTAGTIAAVTVPLGGPDCTVKSVCVLLSGADSTFGTTTSSSCVTVNIPPPTPSTGACVHGSPVSLEYAWVSRGVNPNQASATIWDLKATITLATSGPSSATWWRTQFTTATANGTAAVNFTLANSWVHNTVSRPTDQGPPPDWTRDALPWGFEIWSLPDTWNTPYDPYARTKATFEPTGPSQHFGGITQPVHCRWYIGKKFADITGTTDDPAFDINSGTNDPDPDDPVPEPPLPPETPDDSFNWLAAIWAVLKGIAGTLLGLAGAIASAIADALSGLVDGILDGIAALFIPDDGFMDDAFGDVREQWDDTSVMKWSDAVSGITPGEVSGCGGIPFSVTLPGGAGTPISEHVGAACTGPMATAASVVRACLTAMFIVGGAFACMRGIGAGFGWQPSIGRGDD